LHSQCPFRHVLVQAWRGGGKPQVQLSPRHFSEHTIGAPMPGHLQSLLGPGAHETWLPDVVFLGGATDAATLAGAGGAAFGCRGAFGFPYQRSRARRPSSVPEGFFAESAFGAGVGTAGLAAATGVGLGAQQSAALTCWASVDMAAAKETIITGMYFMIQCSGFEHSLQHLSVFYKRTPTRC
jgi:hypothetical protein